MRYFPETILILGLLAIAVLFWHKTSRTDALASVSLTVEVPPANEIVGSCRFQGRYWKAQRDPNGAFHCFLKDAP